MKIIEMKGRFWLPVVVTVVGCLSLLIWQRKEVASLESEVVSSRQMSAVPEESAVDSALKEDEVSDLEENPGLPKAESRGEFISVSELLASLPDGFNYGSPEFIRSLPQVLSLLEELNADELFILVKELYQADEREPIAANLWYLLTSLLAEEEPERMLAFLAEARKDDGNEEHLLEQSALFALARQDPAKAEAFLENAGWRGPQKSNSERGVLMGWAQSDFQEAIRYFEESGMPSGIAISVLAVAAQEPEVRNEMKQVVLKMEDSPMRRGLTSSLMGAVYDESGFEGVGQLLSEMTFATPDLRDEAISGAANMGLSEKPKETIEWLQEEASSARREEFLENGVRGWARQDYQAAGEWLMSEEPSSDTDKLIAGYAATVVQIDPVAAMTWVDEIQDEKVQEKTRKSSLWEWHKADPAAARNWVVEQGWELEEWFPNPE